MTFLIILARCPKCGSEDLEITDYEALGDYAIRTLIKCEDCGYYFWVDRIPCAKEV